MKSLKIPILTWKKLLKTLRARGQGRRESGAFLLGSSKSNKIKMFVPFDDLDPSALDEGNIMFKGSAFIPLWDICVKHKLQVLALPLCSHTTSWMKCAGIGLPVFLSLTRPVSIGWLIRAFTVVTSPASLARTLIVFAIVLLPLA